MTIVLYGSYTHVPILFDRGKFTRHGDSSPLLPP